MQFNLAAKAPALRQARLELVEHGVLPAHGINERLARSWRRSLDAGLSPAGLLRGGENLSPAELQRRIARNHELASHSRPIMEYLFEQVRHGNNMVVLADNQGVLMHTLGDPGFLGKAERVALVSGASWHEQQRGTNAIGTALAEASGIEIHGAEHYLDRNAFLSCAAAPIAGAAGQLLGILDISCDQRSRHPHTFGLVNTAARMIENRLLVASCQRNIRLHVHRLPEGIGTVAEGILALSEDGWIVGANRAALAMFGLAPADIGATPLDRILDSTLDELLADSRLRGQPGALRLRRPNGELLFALVQAERLAALPGRRADPPARNDALSRIDTGDARWRAAADKARRVNGKNIPLLLLGESGVGKEVFACAVHEASPQRHGPFVAINCAALPESLVEAELFGYSPGAFTGARREGSPGRLREASGGTLFLDEIGDMPLLMQTRLLRVLQERQVTPLGGGQPVKVEFALICATHRNLLRAAEDGSFRSDLYYRINGLSLALPALRERSDFVPLVERILREQSGGEAVHVAPGLLAQLAAFSWPGNLRQLASVLRTAVALLEPGETAIERRHLPDDLQTALAGPSEPRPPCKVGRCPRNLAELSRQAIQDAVEASYGNLSAAARQLGISRQTLYRKLKEK